jgi:hypothetical protein
MGDVDRAVRCVELVPVTEGQAELAGIETRIAACTRPVLGFSPSDKAHTHLHTCMHRTRESVT